MGKRYTDEDRKKIVEERGYELLEINRKRNKKGKSKVYIKIKCDKGHTTEMQWDNFMQGKNCKYCANNVAFTYKEVKEYIESFGYELLSEEYKNENKKILINNKNCNHEPYLTTFSVFKRGCRCPKCGIIKRAESHKYSYEEIKEYIELFNYELLSENYNGNKGYLILKCPNGHEYTVTFSNFKNQSQRCPYCYGNAKYTIEEVREYIESFGYELLSKEYKGSNSPLIIKCPQGHVTDTITYSRFKLGCRCKKCADEKRGDNKKLSYEEVKGYIESFEYKLLSTEYEKSNKKLLIQCNKKHEPYLASWNDFQQGCRCPYCNESKGEKRIEEFLNINNISYIPQYRFKDCKFKNTLPFDFYLLDYNVLIEYDGEQHYKIKDIFGGLDGFVDRIIRDTIKNEYCKKNNIKLIRIPYWDFNNIEKIIVKELNLK